VWGTEAAVREVGWEGGDGERGWQVLRRYTRFDEVGGHGSAEVRRWVGLSFSGRSLIKIYMDWYRGDVLQRTVEDYHIMMASPST